MIGVHFALTNKAENEQKKIISNKSSTAAAEENSLANIIAL